MDIFFPFVTVGFLPGLDSRGFGFPFFPAVFKLLLNVPQPDFNRFLGGFDFFFPGGFKLVQPLLGLIPQFDQGGVFHFVRLASCPLNRLFEGFVNYGGVPGQAGFPLLLHCLYRFPALPDFTLNDFGARLKIGNTGAGPGNDRFHGLFQGFRVFPLKTQFRVAQFLLGPAQGFFNLIQFFFDAADPPAGIFHKDGFIPNPVQIFLHPAGHFDEGDPFRDQVARLIDLGDGPGFGGKLLLGKGVNVPHQLRGGLPLHIQGYAEILNCRAFFLRVDRDIVHALFGVFAHLVQGPVALVQIPV